MAPATMESLLQRNHELRSERARVQAKLDELDEANTRHMDVAQTVNRDIKDLEKRIMREPGVLPARPSTEDMLQQNHQLRSRRSNLQCKTADLEEARAKQVTALDAVSDGLKLLEERISRRPKVPSSPVFKRLSTRIIPVQARLRSGRNIGHELESAPMVAAPEAISLPPSSFQARPTDSAAAFHTPRRDAPQHGTLTITRPGLRSYGGPPRNSVTDGDIFVGVDATFVAFSSDHTMIVKMEGGWHEIWCHICGANAIGINLPNDGNHFMGLPGLSDHIQTRHSLSRGMFAKWTMQDTIERCGKHKLDADELSALRAWKLTTIRVYPEDIRRRSKTGNPPGKSTPIASNSALGKRTAPGSGEERDQDDEEDEWNLFIKKGRSGA